jgi:hypothetical protein
MQRHPWGQTCPWEVSVRLQTTRKHVASCSLHTSGGNVPFLLPVRTNLLTSHVRPTDERDNSYDIFNI